MIFTELKLTGAFLVEPERIVDERGFFSRTWCRQEFQAHGLNPMLVQCSLSYNEKKGTLRGMHYQVAPYEEVRLVRCTMGAVYDVIIDLRPASATFMKSFGVELTAENRKMIYVPEGFAHGFLTLTDRTEIFYQMTQVYAPEYGRGLRWNDSVFGIRWPIDVSVISERDGHYADFILEEEFQH